MKKIAIAAAILIAVVLLAQIAGAQEFSGGPAEGKKELSVAGAIGLQPDNSLIVLADYGKYVTDQTRLGIQITLFDVEDTDTSGTLFLTGTYHFLKDPPSRTVPYAGVGIGSAFLGDGDAVFGFGISAGLKFFTAEDRSFFVEYQWSHFDNDDTSDSSSGILFGVSTLFD